jgi:hypothetical protein
MSFIGLRYVVCKSERVRVADRGHAIPELYLRSGL